MRSATTLRRSGWSPEMFKAGDAITITGSPDRTDPHSCYVSTIVFADGTTRIATGSARSARIRCAGRSARPARRERRAEHRGRLGAGAAS